VLLDLRHLIHEYRLQIEGIIHIGAHHGEEYDVYTELGISKLVFIEPLASNFEALIRRVPEALCIRTAVGSSTGKALMHVAANRGRSSSILEPDLHLAQYPAITFDRMEEVDITTVDALGLSGYNAINVDVQGYELEVFRGAAQTLKTIDCIFTEVNRASLYKGCVLVEDLDAFLATFGFSRLETNWAGKTWGDAFYARPSAVANRRWSWLAEAARLSRRLLGRRSRAR
jgi:FkbM family methyltransferase